MFKFIYDIAKYIDWSYMNLSIFALKSFLAQIDNIQDLFCWYKPTAVIISDLPSKYYIYFWH